MACLTHGELEKFSQRQKVTKEEVEAFESEHGRYPTAEGQHPMAKDTRDLKMGGNPALLKCAARKMSD